MSANTGSKTTDLLTKEQQAVLMWLDPRVDYCKRVNPSSERLPILEGMTAPLRGLSPRRIRYAEGLVAAVIIHYDGSISWSLTARGAMERAKLSAERLAA